MVNAFYSLFNIISWCWLFFQPKFSIIIEISGLIGFWNLLVRSLLWSDRPIYLYFLFTLFLLVVQRSDQLLVSLQDRRPVTYLKRVMKLGVEPRSSRLRASRFSRQSHIYLLTFHIYLLCRFVNRSKLLGVHLEIDKTPQARKTKIL